MGTLAALQLYLAHEASYTDEGRRSNHHEELVMERLKSLVADAIQDELDPEVRADLEFVDEIAALRAERIYV